VSPSTTAALVSLVIALLSFQAGATLAKGLIAAVGAPGTTTLRLAMSAIILCVAQRPWRSWPSGASIRPLLVYGLALGTMNFSFYAALGRIPLGIAVGLEFTGPLAVALWMSRRRLDLVWLASAVIGVICLLPVTAAAGTLNPVGVGAALTAGVCWATYIIYGQKAGRAQGASASTWGVLIAALAVAPIGAWHAGRVLLSPSILPTGLAVAVLSSALPYTLEMTALRGLSARTYGTLMSLDPALAALAGLLLLHERLTLVQWVGIVAVMTASIGALGHEPVVPEQVP
jgi:inner membrane transporter RhtA